MHSFLKQKLSKWSDWSHQVFTFIICLPLFITPFITCSGFSQTYITIKWVIVLTNLLCLFFLYLCYSRELLFPQVPRKALYGIGCLVLTLIFNAFYHGVPLFICDNLRRTIFWFAAICFFIFFSRMKNSLFEYVQKTTYISLGVFITLALIQYAISPFSPPYFTFGNANLAAENIVIFLAFPLAKLTQKWRKEENSVVLRLLCALTLAYLYLTCCRSVYIELTLIFFVILLNTKNSFKELLKIGILSFVTVIFIHDLLPFFMSLFTLKVSSSSPEFFQCVLPSPILSKPFSFRWLMYLDTLDLIFHTPLGVGVGQFEFASLPYFTNLFPEHNETLIFLTPHNEFLHYLAEEGVIVFLLIVGISLYVCLTFWKEGVVIFKEHPEFTFLMIIFGGEALFQFPLVEPIPYFIAALMLGRFFSLLRCSPLSYTIPPFVRGILLGATFFLFVGLGVHYTAEYIAHSYPKNVFLNKKACSNFTRNWSSCLNLSSVYLKRGDLSQAEFYALKTLQWQPLNYHGMALLGLTARQQGKKEKACKLFKKYDALFQNQSSFHNIILKECSS